jgi:hypothetical protein
MENVNDAASLRALPPLTLASVLPLSQATDEEMSNLAHYHQGERIIRAAPASQPAGYIDRKDLVMLGKCRVTLWANAEKIDPVSLFRAPPEAMLQDFLSIIHDRDLAVGDRLQRIASRITFYCKVADLMQTVTLLASATCMHTTGGLMGRIHGDVRCDLSMQATDKFIVLPKHRVQFDRRQTS